MDSGLFRVLGRVADLMILNILFIVCCIPIVTIGPALTGMYYVTMKMAQNEEGYIARGFLKSFKQNFRQALIIWLIMLLIGVVLVADLLILRGSSGTLFNVIRVVILATSIFYVIVLIYVFPTLARFYNSIRMTIRNSAIMAIADFPRTVAMVAIIVAAVVVTLLNGYTLMYGILIWLMLGFSTIAYANSFFLNKVYAKYIPKEQEDEEESEEADGEAIEAEDMAAIETKDETPAAAEDGAPAGEIGGEAAVTENDNPAQETGGGNAGPEGEIPNQ